jgi:hypothetical protein
MEITNEEFRRLARTGEYAPTEPPPPETVMGGELQTIPRRRG